MGKKCEGGSVRVEIFGNDKLNHCQIKNLKITFFTDAPFIVKFRFEKYRYLLTYLLCIQIFEAPLSHNHSTGPQNVSAAFNCHCSSECVCCLLPVLSDDTHFVPKYMMKVKLIKY